MSPSRGLGRGDDVGGERTGTEGAEPTENETANRTVLLDVAERSKPLLGRFVTVALDRRAELDGLAPLADHVA